MYCSAVQFRTRLLHTVVWRLREEERMGEGEKERERSRGNKKEEERRKKEM